MVDSPWMVVGFADDGIAEGTKILDLLVLGPISDVLRLRAGPGSTAFHCGIGSNAVRGRLAAEAERLGLIPASLIDPSAVVAESATLGGGCYIGPHSFIGPEARLGRHVLVNAGASVGHHSDVGDFAQICPGARLSGKVRLGAAAFVGSNGVVAPGVQVGANATVGAASFAARDVPDRATAIGVPAKILAAPAPPT